MTNDTYYEFDGSIYYVNINGAVMRLELYDGESDCVSDFNIVDKLPKDAIKLNFNDSRLANVPFELWDEMQQVLA